MEDPAKIITEQISQMNEKLLFMRPAVELLRLEYEDMVLSEKLGKMKARLNEQSLEDIRKSIVFLLDEWFCAERDKASGLYEQINDMFIMLKDNAPDPIDNPDEYHAYLWKRFPDKAEKIGAPKPIDLFNQIADITRPANGT